MSDRRLPVPDERAVHLMREILDRLDRLEHGSTLKGLVSFRSIQVGDVTITITPGAGLHRTVVFTNVLNGLTSTIVL